MREKRDRMHYRNASPRLCGLNVGLKVQRGVEIAAGVPIASALDSVHADRHRAVLVRLHRLEGVRKPALRLAAFARPALKLATYLQQERTRMAWALYLWEFGTDYMELIYTMAAPRKRLGRANANTNQTEDQTAVERGS